MNTEGAAGAGGADRRPAILLIAGFGDGPSAYAPLVHSALVKRYRPVPVDLPGFAGTAPFEGPTTLERLAGVVDRAAEREGARAVIAHSAASIIASLAARRSPTKIEIILSLEGNLVAEDAYFSGTAADYGSASEFKAAFLARIDEMAEDQPALSRYRSVVATANARALWELGCDVRRFSAQQVPGDVLLETPHVWYLYNPANCPEASLEWLSRNAIRAVQLEGAGHWAAMDQPDTVAAVSLRALEEIGP